MIKNVELTWTSCILTNEHEDPTWSNYASPKRGIYQALCNVSWKSKLWKEKDPAKKITFTRLNIREKNHSNPIWEQSNIYKTCQRCILGIDNLSTLPSRCFWFRSEPRFLGSWQLPAPLGGRHAGRGMRTSAKSRVLKPPARWGPLTTSLDEHNLG